MDEIKEITDALNPAASQRTGKSAVPILEVLALFATGLPVHLKSSPRIVALHATEYLRTLKDKVIYHGYQTAVLLGYTFK